MGRCIIIYNWTFSYLDLWRFFLLCYPDQRDWSRVLCLLLGPDNIYNSCGRVKHYRGKGQKLALRRFVLAKLGLHEENNHADRCNTINGTINMLGLKILWNHLWWMIIPNTMNGTFFTDFSFLNSRVKCFVSKWYGF